MKLSSGLVSCAMLSIVAAACGDEDPAAPRQVPVAPAAALTRVTPEELHRRNPMDWVGRRHREGIMDFAAGMRSRKGKRGPICSQMVQAAVSVARRSAPRIDAADLLRSAKAGAGGTAFCRGKKERVRPALFQGSGGSPAYVSLAGAVLQHVDGAADVNDLASRLGNVLDDASTQLGNPDERTAIQSMVAIAFDSYEYNSTHWIPVDEFGAEYGDCVVQDPNWGWEDIGAEPCTGGAGGGDEWETGFRGMPHATRPFTLASLSYESSHCIWMEDHFHLESGGIGTAHKNLARRIAGADALGAFGGFIVGAFFGPAVGPAMLAGGAGASAGALAEASYHAYMCMAAT